MPSILLLYIVMQCVLVPTLYTLLDCRIFPQTLHGVKTLRWKGVVGANICGGSYNTLEFLPTSEQQESHEIPAGFSLAIPCFHNSGPVPAFLPQ